MDDSNKRSSLDDIDTPSVPSNEGNDESPALSFITTLGIIAILVVGLYFLYAHFSKTHNIPAVTNVLKHLNQTPGQPAPGQ